MTWLSGAAAPTADIGRLGDFYLDQKTGDVWKKKSDFFGVPPRWTKHLNLVGPPGEKGKQGERGASGISGGGGGTSTASASVNYASEITPTTLAADTHNYAPPGGASASVWNLSASADLSLTGISAAGRVSGDILVLQNSGSGTITLPFASSSSSVGNRFEGGLLTTAIDSAGAVVLKYTTTTNTGNPGWQILASMDCFVASGSSLFVALSRRRKSRRTRITTAQQTGVCTGQCCGWTAMPPGASLAWLVV